MNVIFNILVDANLLLSHCGVKLLVTYMQQKVMPGSLWFYIR